MQPPLRPAIAAGGLSRIFVLDRHDAYSACGFFGWWRRFIAGFVRTATPRRRGGRLNRAVVGKQRRAVGRARRGKNGSGGNGVKSRMRHHQLRSRWHGRAAGMGLLLMMRQVGKKWGRLLRGFVEALLIEFHTGPGASGNAGGRCRCQQNCITRCSKIAVHVHFRSIKNSPDAQPRTNRHSARCVCCSSLTSAKTCRKLSCNPQSLPKRPDPTRRKGRNRRPPLLSTNATTPNGCFLPSRFQGAVGGRSPPQRRATVFAATGTGRWGRKHKAARFATKSFAETAFRARR